MSSFLNPQAQAALRQWTDDDIRGMVETTAVITACGNGNEEEARRLIAGSADLPLLAITLANWAKAQVHTISALTGVPPWDYIQAQGQMIAEEAVRRGLS